MRAGCGGGESRRNEVGKLSLISRQLTNPFLGAVKTAATLRGTRAKRKLQNGDAAESKTVSQAGIFGWPGDGIRLVLSRENSAPRWSP